VALKERHGAKSSKKLQKEINNMRDKQFFKEIANMMLEDVDLDNEVEMGRQEKEIIRNQLAKHLEDRDFVNEFPTLSELNDLVNGEEFVCKQYKEIDETLKDYFDKATE
jgi:hypothetical protein